MVDGHKNFSKAKMSNKFSVLTPKELNMNSHIFFADFAKKIPINVEMKSSSKKNSLRKIFYNLMKLKVHKNDSVRIFVSVLKSLTWR